MKKADAFLKKIDNLKKENFKKDLLKIVNEMTDLEVEMARKSYEFNGATVPMVAEWVTRSSFMSSKLDKLYKEL